MKNLLKYGSVAMLLAISPAAFAQDATESSSEEFPVGTEPVIQPGQQYARETFGDWEMLCIKTAEGPEPCEIGQLILDDKGNAITDVRIFPLPTGSAAIAGANFVTPLGVSLQNGLLYGVDDKDPKQYPYQFCNNIGCVARVGITPLELQAMRKGEFGKMSFAMMNNPAQAITVGISLKGFAAAFAALLKLQLEQQK